MYLFIIFLVQYFKNILNATDDKLCPVVFIQVERLTFMYVLSAL